MSQTPVGTSYVLTLIEQLSSNLSDEFTYRIEEGCVKVYCKGRLVLHIAGQLTHNQLTRLNSNAIVSAANDDRIGNDVLFAVCDCIVFGKHLMKKWFDEHTINTYERNLAYKVADVETVCHAISEFSKQIQPCLVPSTYDDVIKHILAPRAAQLLRDASF